MARSDPTLRRCSLIHRFAKGLGFFVETPENLHKWTQAADKVGLQVIVHAIGDRAINSQLNIFEQVARENGQRIAASDRARTASHRD
jgi:predicted amidohydrolase YtcJ